MAMKEIKEIFIILWQIFSDITVWGPILFGLLFIGSIICVVLGCREIIHPGFLISGAVVLGIEVPFLTQGFIRAYLIRSKRTKRAWKEEQ